MNQKWHPTKYSGVRYREHNSRKTGTSGAKDRYFCIYYRLGNKIKWEAIGWQSQGVTPEKANMELVDRKNNIRNGVPAITIKQRKALLVKQFKSLEMQKITFGEYLDKNYIPKIARRYKHSSFKRVMSIFTKWLLPIFSYKIISAIDSDDWEAFYQSVASSQLAGRTKIYISREMLRIMKDARDSGIPDVHLPSKKELFFEAPNNRRERIILPKEAKLILQQLYKVDKFAYRITKFAFLTGCRFSECAKLRKESVYDDFILCRDTKNKSNKKVIISSAIHQLLKSGHYSKPAELLFPNKFGKQYSQPPKVFMRTVDALHLNDGRDRLDKITFHSIRHSVATELAKTLDMRTLMDFMGWKRIDMALRYIHNNYAAAKNAAEKLKGFSD